LELFWLLLFWLLLFWLLLFWLLLFWEEFLVFAFDVEFLSRLCSLL